MGNGCHGNHHGNMCKLLCIILPLIKRLNLVLGYSFPGNHQLDSCLDSGHDFLIRSGRIKMMHT